MTETADDRLRERLREAARVPGPVRAVMSLNQEDARALLTVMQPVPASEDKRVCLACGLRADKADEWCRSTRDTDHRWTAA